jgi:hypothetical protein
VTNTNLNKEILTARAKCENCNIVHCKIVQRNHIAIRIAMQEFRDEEDISSEEDNVAVPAPQTRRGSGLTWNTISSMTVDQAKQEYEEKINTNCVKGNVQETQAGTKKYLKCAWHKQGCKKQWHFDFVSSSTEVYLRENTEQHNHDTDIDRPESSAGLPENIKSIIQTCLVANPLAKPKQIIQEIRKVVPAAEEPADLSKRISNYTARWRKNHYGKSNPTIADLAAFAQENLGIPIGNLDEAYVIGFEAPDSSGSDGVPKFRIVLSSQRLLHHIPPQNLTQIQADATYKLIWQGFPVLVVGSSDANKMFHPICVAICAHETEEDFKFVFRSLAAAIPGLSPQFSLSDGADAIFNAARSVWPQISRVMCYSHVHMNVVRKANAIPDSQVRTAKGYQCSPVSAKSSSF